MFKNLLKKVIKEKTREVIFHTTLGMNPIARLVPLAKTFKKMVKR